MPATKKVKKSKSKSDAEPVIDAALEEPTTFSLFPKLPIELRVEIWGYASSATRNVDIWVRSLNIELRYSCKPVLYFCSSLPPPAVLHVNSESCSESLKYYNLDFGTNLSFRHMDTVPFTISSPGRVYFNSNTDRLCLVNLSDFESKRIVWEVSKQLVDYYGECQKKGFRYFAINIARSFLPGFSEDLTFLKYIPRKSNLQEVVLFECSRLADSDTLKINRLELEDLGSKDQGKRMQYAKRALEKALKKDLENTGDISGVGTPLIRTCKVNVELIW